MTIREYRPVPGWLVRKIIDTEKLTVVFWCGGIKEAEFSPSTGVWKTNSYGAADTKIVEKCTKLMKSDPSIEIADYDITVIDGKVTVTENK